MSEAELRDRLEDSEQLPYGDARTAVVEEILVRTDALGMSKLAFDVRMELISCYENGALPDRAFVPFAWCLAAFDRGELEFSAWDAELLRWYYKWMIGAMRRFPSISLDQVYAALADMERRYRAGGHSMHAVHMLRCLVHSHLGDREAAEKEFGSWLSSPRDENSDCVGCEPTKQLNHHVWMGRDAEGLALAEPALAGERGCREQPQSMLTAMMFPLVRAGRLGEAWGCAPAGVSAPSRQPGLDGRHRRPPGILCADRKRDAWAGDSHPAPGVGGPAPGALLGHGVRGQRRVGGVAAAGRTRPRRSFPYPARLWDPSGGRGSGRRPACRTHRASAVHRSPVRCPQREHVPERGLAETPRESAVG
ncbi:hypothetical protein [Fodinicola feengrottensis]|uniref:hypothetical protein n=1 Tax=Fodinicola feengrottensis TaxID=435914 RepID=UPI002442936A|nr:hypothetical protein [Fodinicola feengrottensis]